MIRSFLKVTFAYFTSNLFLQNALSMCVEDCSLSCINWNILRVVSKSLTSATWGAKIATNIQYVLICDDSVETVR